MVEQLGLNVTAETVLSLSRDDIMLVVYECFVEYTLLGKLLT